MDPLLSPSQSIWEDCLFPVCILDWICNISLSWSKTRKAHLPWTNTFHYIVRDYFLVRKFSLYINSIFMLVNNIKKRYHSTSRNVIQECIKTDIYQCQKHDIQQCPKKDITECQNLIFTDVRKYWSTLSNVKK